MNISLRQLAIGKIGVGSDIRSLSRVGNAEGFQENPTAGPRTPLGLDGPEIKVLVLEVLLNLI